MGFSKPSNTLRPAAGADGLNGSPGLTHSLLPSSPCLPAQGMGLSQDQGQAGLTGSPALPSLTGGRGQCSSLSLSLQFSLCS